MEEEESQAISTVISSIRTGEFNVSSFQGTIFFLLEVGKGNQIIEALLQEEADISTQDFGPTEPEQMRIRNYHRHNVQLLVNNVGNCDFYDEKKKTVLHHASRWGWLKIVQSLLEKGADPNARDIENGTSLMLATKYQHKEVVNLLVQSGANVLFCKSDNYTLLHAASANGWLDFVQFLLDSGADPNAETSVGWQTPLKEAVERNLKDVVVLLINNGANVKISLTKRSSILHFATRKGYVQILQCLMEKVGPERCNILSLLSYACLFGQMETMEYLVKVRNTVNKSHDTTLNCVVSMYRPYLKVAKSCIERGDYLDFVYFAKVLNNSSLKRGILQNIQMCTKAIINHFNYKDLPDLYKIPMSAERLPSMEKLTIKSESLIQHIEQGVQREIEIKGHCNLVRPRVILLSMLSVRSYIDYYDGLMNKTQLLQKTSAADDEPSTKIQCLDCNVFFEAGSDCYVLHNCQ